MQRPQFATLVCLGLIAAASAVAFTQVPAKAAARTSSSATPTDAEIKSRIADFLNRTVGWQNLDKMEVLSISAPESGIRTVKVLLAKGEQHQDATYYITADGKEIIEGEISKLNGDPWAEIRGKINTQGAPATGAVSAPVTIVEFSDLECPYCKQAAASIAQLMQEDPGKVRVIFKYYPLTSIHPWSMQAATTAACVAEQNPAQFWNFEKAVFDHQDDMTVANVGQRLHDYALESGAQAAPLAACVASPATKAKIEASIANGNDIGVTTTPTLFINGREIPGAVDTDQLKKLVDHEAAVGPALNAKIQGQQCGECKPLAPIIHHP